MTCDFTSFLTVFQSYQDEMQRLTTFTPPTFFAELYSFFNFQYRNCVRSITLIPFEIMSQNLVEIQSMSRRGAKINKGHSIYIFCGIIPFDIFSVEIVSAV